MTLEATLSAKLDIGLLIEGLLREVGDVSAALGAIEAPVDRAEVDAAGGLGAEVSVEGIDAAVARVADRIEPALASLPDAGAALGPLRATIGLFEQVTDADLETTMSGLAARLGEVLEGGREGGFLAALQSFATALAEAPEGRILRNLLGSALGAAALDAPGGAPALARLAPAAVAGMQVLGGLMALESVLAEAERLGRVMAERLDAAAIQARCDGLVAALSGEGASLAHRLGTLDTDDPAALAAARDAIAAARLQLFELERTLAEGMAFGEGTLVYLDLGQLRAQLAVAASLVRETALESVSEALTALVGILGPALRVDLAGAPANTLDGLLSQLEGAVDDLAARIRAFDAAAVSGPVTDTLAEVADIARTMREAVTDARLAVTGALEQARAVVQGLPFGEIAGAVRRLVEPLARALEAIAALVAEVEEAIGTALGTAQAQLDKAEAALDGFKGAVQASFDEAAKVLDPERLNQVIGKVSDNVRAFADEVARARMKPYIDSAVDTIEGTASVIEQVPFALLPDAMEAEVAAALRPIKQADLEAFEGEVREVLGLGPEGRLEFRTDVETALAQIQAKYDSLIAEVRRLDPRKEIASIDRELQNLAQVIEAIAPSLDLAPLREAIAQLKEAVAGVDPNAVLAPLEQGVASVLAGIDRYAPSALITPLEEDLDRARTGVVDLIRLRQWSETLDSLATEARALIDRLDPAGLEPMITGTLGEARDLLEAYPERVNAAAFGAMVADLLEGAGLKVHPAAFQSVLGWLWAGSGTHLLTARADRIAQSIALTGAAVEAVDPAALAARLDAALVPVGRAAATIGDTSARLALEADLRELVPAAVLGPMGPNRSRYMGLLGQASAAAEEIRRTGLSEVDVALARLDAAIAPLRPLGELLREVLGRLGISGLHEGMAEVMRRVFQAAPPERLAALAAPIFLALRERAVDLLDSVITPLRQAIDDLIAATDGIDLTPLRESVEGVQEAVRSEVMAMRPDIVLDEAISALRAAQAQIATFDPLANLQQSLDRFGAAAARLVGKLSTDAILEKPLELYDRLLEALARLDLIAILAPLLEQIDAIASEVSDGLDRTVGAFERLQEALPERVGSTSLSTSASVG